MPRAMLIRVFSALFRGRARATKGSRARSPATCPKVTAQADASFGTDARTRHWLRIRARAQAAIRSCFRSPSSMVDAPPSAIREAAANAGAQRETARVIEQQVMLAAVTAYVDVRQDRRILRINQQNVAALEVTARAARRRKDVSEATIADVSQAEAALAGGRAELELATSTLSADEAAFEATVLHPPTALESPPSVLHLMPKDRQSAVALSEHESRSSLRLCFERRAHAIRLNGPSATDAEPRAADRLSTPRRKPARNRRNERLRRARSSDCTNLHWWRNRVRHPRRSSQSCSIAAGRRRCPHKHTSRRCPGLGAANSARSAIKSVKQQVAANRAALAGLQAEYRVGQRSMLDILTTQQALFQSAITQERTERDLVVAAYTVLGLIGRLDPESIARPADGVRNGEADVAWTATIAAPKEASKPLKKIAQPAPPVSWTITVQKAH